MRRVPRGLAAARRGMRCGLTPTGDSAAAVVVNESSAMAVLARQFRFPTVAKCPSWMLELVAGTVEVDESPEQCIRREIVEEYGYETLTLRRLCTFYTSPGGSSERIHLFQAIIGAATRTGDAGGGGFKGSVHHMR